jgi:exportin-2 (importin alpha re-exporter)
MLGIFQRLNASSATETSAFELLRALTTYIPQENMMPSVPTIFQIILTKLSTTKTQKYPPLVVSYLALFAGLFGGKAFLDITNRIQPGVGLTLLSQVWVPKLKAVMQNQIECKIQVVGLSRLLCDTPALLEDSNGQQIWAQTFKGVVGILTSQSFTARDIEDDEADADIGYDATFSRLSLAAKKPDDPFVNVTDPVSVFTQAVQTLSSQRPGVLGAIIQSSLSDDPKLAAGFQTMVQQAGANIA